MEELLDTQTYSNGVYETCRPFTTSRPQLVERTQHSSSHALYLPHIHTQLLSDALIPHSRLSNRSTAMLLKLLEAVPHHAGRGGELRRAAEMRVHDLVKAEQTRLEAVATYAAAVSGGEGYDPAAEEALRHSVRTHTHPHSQEDLWTCTPCRTQTDPPPTEPRRCAQMRPSSPWDSPSRV